MTELTITMMKAPKKSIRSNLGLFNGYDFRSQSKMDRLFSANEVINWDHHKDGDAQFRPSGDHKGVFEVFKRKDWYYEPDLHKDYFENWEIQHLDELIDAYGDEPGTFAKIIWHLEKGCRFLDVTISEIKEANLYVYRGENFLTLMKKAADEIFKILYPEDYKLSLNSCCRWLTFDHYRFLSGPIFSTMEITIGNENFLVVYNKK